LGFWEKPSREADEIFRKKLDCSQMQWLMISEGKW